MNKDDSFYIKELRPIREFCLRSDKEDVYKYIYSLQQENQQLQQKVNQLETNRDEALNLMKKCKFDKTDKYIPISEYKEYQELKAILERGKE